jgi:phosphatidylserine/phosphatidylglycerophosphate/cardiolipin synthase-like enzyme
MRLIVQPKDGVQPLLDAIAQAKKSVDIVIFRFDLRELEEALKAACKRGVDVHALVAHTAGSGNNSLRSLESRLLEYGATVARTDDDLVRYHGKLLLIDKATLYVLGFNYTYQDIRRSRSFAVAVKKPSVVREAIRLIKSDEDRSEVFRPSRSNLVISPENARDRLLRFIRKARRELLIYDDCVSDDEMLAALKKRAGAGVRIRVIGRVEKKWRGKGLKVRKAGLRLHVRAMVRDGNRAFIGSQSLRRLELDERREVGIVIREKRIVRKIERVFESDWKKASK